MNPHGSATEETHMADPPVYADSNSDTGDVTGSTPRWVKVFGIIVILLVLLFVVLQLTGVAGRHGPGGGRHTLSGDAGTPPASVPGGHTPPSGVTHGEQQP